jgi:TRAP transporter TAXI family solute receptor
MRTKAWFATALVLLLAGFSGNALAQTKKQVVIGATSSASSVFVYFVSLAKAINQHAPDLNATVVETGATVDNLRRLERGQIDLGLATGETTALKFAGEGPFAGAANPKLRTLIVFDDLAHMYVVRADAGIHGFRDLEGKPFNAGINGSATEFTTTTMFQILGIKIQPFKGTTGDAVNAIKDRRIVGYAKAGVRDASILDVMATTPVNFLSFTEEEEKLLKPKMPKGILWYTLPKDLYPGVGEIRTFGLAPGIITTTAFPADEAQAVLAAQDKAFEQIAAAYPNIAGQNLWAKTVEGAGAPLHAGTVKFLREKGIAIPPDLVPPEAK